MSIWHTPEREQLRKTVRAFAEREVLPNVDEWERSGMLPRDLHLKAGEAGLLGAGLPESVGGGGGDGGSGGAGLGRGVAGVADAGGEAVGGRVVGLAVVGEGLGAELVGDAVDLCLGGMC